MKRILIFALTYHPFVGGAEVAVKEITDRLSGGEYAFDLITLRFDRNLPKVEKFGNVTIHRVGFSMRGAKVSDRSMPLRCKLAKVLFPLTSLFTAIQLQRKSPYQAVWAIMANQAGFGALFFSTLFRVHMILELQDGRAFVEMKQRRPILRLLWPLYRRIYQQAVVIKCISNFIAKEVRAIGYAGRVEVIPNGVDVARFSAALSDEQRTALRARYGFGPNDVVLFTASRLVLSRGVEDAIGALAHLTSQVKLFIAGEGEDKEKLAHIARGLGVADRVVFGGFVNHSDLPALLHASDVFVRPSIIEGMGNAFIEAFAAGVPIIGTPVGGIPDFLVNGETGLFCEVRNPVSVAEAVERYRSEPALGARVVANGKVLAAERYDWKLIAQDMDEKIFSNVCAS